MNDVVLNWSDVKSLRDRYCRAAFVSKVARDASPLSLPLFACLLGGQAQS